MPENGRAFGTPSRRPLVALLFPFVGLPPVAILEPSGHGHGKEQGICQISANFMLSGAELIFRADDVGLFRTFVLGDGA